MDLQLVMIVSLILCAYFSGMETAFVNANKIRLELDKKKAILPSKVIFRYLEKPVQFMSFLLIGKVLSMVSFGLCFFQFVHPLLLTHFSIFGSLALEIIIMALILLLVAEYLPKIIFRINPNGLLNFFSIPTALFYFLFYPLTLLILGISKAVLKITLGEDYKGLNEKLIFNRIDLDLMVSKSERSNHAPLNEEIDNEVKLFRNAMDFSKVKLREIMVPRTEIVAMDIHSTVEELQQKFIETGYSRILFYEENIDNIIGYIHHSVIFSKPDSITSNLSNVLVVPETMPANKLLGLFIQERLSIAVVVDEFGGTSGMVTSEDILEQIFGEIEDEHDTVDIIKKQIKPNEYIISGRAELDDLNERFNFDFMEREEYETLAGFILYHYESIPKVNTIIEIGRYRFKILKATHTKIELVHLHILDNN
ncbi:MAG: hemolysin family protein [Candidatus Saccharibacteria bacterium]